MFKGDKALQYAKNSGWMLADRILRMLSAIFVGALVAKYLGPYDYGIYSYNIALLLLLAGLTKLGLESIVIKDFISAQKTIREVFITSLILKLSASFLLLLLLLGSSTFMHTNRYILILSLVLIFESFEVVDYFFQSRLLSNVNTKIKFGQVLLGLTLKLLGIYLNFGLSYFLWVYVAESICMALLRCVAISKLRLAFRLSDVNRDYALNLLNRGKPLLLSGFVITIYMRSDQLMLRYLTDYETLGVYSAALKVTEGLYFIPMVIGASLYPALLNSYGKESQTYENRLTRLYRLNIWIAIFLAILVSIFSNILITILFGNQFVDAVKIVFIHCWTLVFIAMGIITDKHLLVVDQNHLTFKRGLCGAIANIVLNSILIPKYGAQGAALGTLVSQILSNLIYDFFDYRLRSQLKMKWCAVISPFLFLIKK